MSKNAAKNLVNHVTFVLDESGSMGGLTEGVIKLFDNQVKSLIDTSKKNNQETRVSVFKFSSGYSRDAQIQCIIFDTDVLRVPSISGLYRPNGGTPMIMGVTESINDLLKIPEMFGDHAHLMYVITDGQETDNRSEGNTLKQRIKTLPNNWSIGCLVPNENCKREAVSYGFDVENCFIWEQTEKGIEKINAVMQETTQTFMSARATGVRSMTSMFKKVDLAKVDKKEVQSKLAYIPHGDFVLCDITKDEVIRPYVENNLKLTWVKGKGFYELTKLEEVQDYKEICVRDTRNGCLYTGANARKLIGLPEKGTAKVKPEGSGIYQIFVQSTSINRKLPAKTKFVYLTK
jgi:hypothetical protein